MVANFPNKSDKNSRRRAPTFSNLAYLRRTMAAQGLMPASARASTVRPRAVGTIVRVNAAQTPPSSDAATLARLRAQAQALRAVIDRRQAQIEALRRQAQIGALRRQAQIDALTRQVADTAARIMQLRQAGITPTAQPNELNIQTRLGAIAERIPALKPLVDGIRARVEKLRTIPADHRPLYHEEFRANFVQIQQVMHMAARHDIARANAAFQAAAAARAASSAAAVYRAGSGAQTAVPAARRSLPGQGLRLTFAMVPFDSVPLTTQCEALDKAFGNAPSTQNGTATVMTPRPFRFTIEILTAADTWTVQKAGFVPDLAAAQEMKTKAVRQFLEHAVKSADAWRKNEAVRMSRMPFWVEIDVRIINENGQMLKRRKQVARI
ncbi:unnamed protein product [Zymoseptoria tritici ST99CH_1A5]|uniref:Uncharacterized protein n=2 Tax=Zymoseptoria tritici TaxID=1047171 RepID=A0A2H1GPL8_ZYMTR|nr:unnamed protein product [Zymoseptoria tritici ST99CH_1E4]SMY26334.1 unnamed protein product [Zymoseptoria tritici ST99CH_1A5]